MLLITALIWLILKFQTAPDVKRECNRDADLYDKNSDYDSGPCDDINLFLRLKEWMRLMRTMAMLTVLLLRADQIGTRSEIWSRQL